MTKTSAAQREAIKKYNYAHKKQHQLYSYRSYARKFVNELATPKDLDELEQRIQARRAELNN